MPRVIWGLEKGKISRPIRGNRKMHINELIDQGKRKDTQNKLPRKRHALKLTLLIIASIIAVLTIIVVLLLHKPSSFEPPQAIEDKQVSKYLTHVISQELYNGAQRGEPFELVITEEGICDIVARSGWPKQLGEISFAIPQVKFEPDCILLRGTVNLDRVELFVLIEGTGSIDEQRLLHLNVTKVKVGAVSLTAAAKLVASALYNDQIARGRLKTDDLRAKVMTALLHDEPFEPVFEIDETRIRIDDMKIESGTVRIHFVPHGQ